VQCGELVESVKGLAQGQQMPLIYNDAPAVRPRFKKLGRQRYGSSQPIALPDAPKDAPKLPNLYRG
jgi:hypothetical protein